MTEPNPSSKLPINKLHNQEYYQKVLKSWTDSYGGLGDADFELANYSFCVDKLIAGGGSVFRLLFVNNLSEIDTRNFGHHWTSSHENLSMLGSELQACYGKGKSLAYVIEAIVPPGSISNECVDIAGNPNEQEVNIIANFDKISYKIFESNNKYDPARLVTTIPSHDHLLDTSLAF